LFYFLVLYISLREHFFTYLRPVFEMVFINSTYEWPELTEIVKYIKAVAMLTLVTALPLWYSEKGNQVVDVCGTYGGK